MSKPTAVDTYIQSFPKDTREKLQTLRQLVKEIVPEAEETISYGIPTFTLHGKYVVYIAGYKNHISLYPVFDTMETSLPEISKYRAGKGTLRFPLATPPPLSLIRKVVKLLVRAQQERTGKKAG